MTEFRAILGVQWTRTRLVVTLIALGAFGLPEYIVGQRIIGGSDTYGGATFWMDAADTLGRGFPLLALGLGLALGVLSWADDQRMGHVYALSLPQARERYVLLRFGAGFLMLLVPVAALLAGALIATAAVDLPDGIHAYPAALTARFGLAALTTYSVFFSLAVATRRAARIIALILVLVVVGELVFMMLDLELSLMEYVLAGVTKWPSPFALLTGRWSLFDV